MDDRRTVDALLEELKGKDGSSISEASRQLKLGKPKVDKRATDILRSQKPKVFRAKYEPGSLNGALYAAAYYARKMKEIMFIYEGSSFMHRVYRISHKPDDYLNPINNTGGAVISVSPELEVVKYDIVR